MTKARLEGNQSLKPSSDRSMLSVNPLCMFVAENTPNRCRGDLTRQAEMVAGRFFTRYAHLGVTGTIARASCQGFDSPGAGFFFKWSFDMSTSSFFRGITEKCVLQRTSHSDYS
jgi:hypothetical protein